MPSAPCARERRARVRRWRRAAREPASLQAAPPATRAAHAARNARARCRAPAAMAADMRRAAQTRAARPGRKHKEASRLQRLCRLRLRRQEARAHPQKARAHGRHPPPSLSPCARHPRAPAARARGRAEYRQGAALAQRLREPLMREPASLHSQRRAHRPLASPARLLRAHRALARRQRATMQSGLEPMEYPGATAARGPPARRIARAHPGRPGRRWPSVVRVSDACARRAGRPAISTAPWTTRGARRRRRRAAHACTARWPGTSKPRTRDEAVDDASASKEGDRDFLRHCAGLVDCACAGRRRPRPSPRHAAPMHHAAMPCCHHTLTPPARAYPRPHLARETIPPPPPPPPPQAPHPAASRRGRALRQHRPERHAVAAPAAAPPAPPPAPAARRGTPPVAAPAAAAAACTLPRQRRRRRSRCSSCA